MDSRPQPLRGGGGRDEGLRRYDWVRLPLIEPGELTAYVYFAPAGTTLARLVRVVGRR